MAAKTDPEIYLEWNIVYKKFKYKKDRDKDIQILLKKVKENLEPSEGFVPLEYEVFKSETNNLSFVLRVYKKTVTKSKSSNKERSINIEDSGDQGEDFSGPIRPNGPPKPPPPGIERITPNMPPQ